MAKSTNLSKNTLFLSACMLLNKGLLFVMIPFFSKWLSTEEFGIYDVYTTYISLLIPIITLACSDAVFRLSFDKDNIDGKSYYITNGGLIVFVNLSITLVIIGIFSHISCWVNAIPFLILLIAEVIDNFLQGYLRAIKKLNVYAITKSITVIFTSIAVTVLVRILDLGLNGIMYGYALGYLCGSCFAIIITRLWSYIRVRRIHFNGVKELISYSYALIPNSISWWVINVSDRSIINLFLGVAFNGVYAIACKIPNLCSAVFSVFSISWQEAATEMVNEKERNLYFNNVYNPMLTVLLTLCGCILSCNFILFGYIFDEKYNDARLYTSILVTAVIFSSLSQFFGGIQISFKRPKANGVTTIIGAFANLIIHLPLVKLWGLYAAAASTLVSNMIITILRKHMLRNDVCFSLSKANIIYTMVYMYFAIMAYISLQMPVNLLNLMLSGTVFLFANRKLIMSIVTVVTVRKK